eukprot:TRINITY_DN938_c0_g1_i3.p1 TRINITY_DN938_c0_g1~~TRINITY_DN938_c0_g1_i3.p1  ORF type:complete len:256 (+),score=51.86 TRINITY_DN938_c0_g1_i3:365-1132(+)
MENKKRTLKISFEEEITGNVEVKLGETRVIASVKAEIVEPFPDRPTEGFFNFNVEFSPMADPNFESNRITESAIEVGRVIERGLRESRAIDSEALCIIASEKVWSVRCDIHIVDNNGNLIDCASIAVITALLHFRRESVSVNGSQLTVHPISEKESVPLSVHHVPVCVTFGFFGEGNTMVVDPILKEELILDGKMTITLNSHREICAIQKAGGTAVSQELVMQCIRIAAVKVEEISEKIQTAIKSDADKRARLRS